MEDLDEEDTNPLSPLDKQCQEIWNTVQLKAVWRPMVRHDIAMVSVTYICVYVYVTLLVV